jgi:hypothetical protein
MVVEGVEGVKYDELVNRITNWRKEKRKGSWN